jgi:hypothetical protein
MKVILEKYLLHYQNMSHTCTQMKPASMQYLSHYSTYQQQACNTCHTTTLPKHVLHLYPSEGNKHAIPVVYPKHVSHLHLSEGSKHAVPITLPKTYRQQPCYTCHTTKNMSRTCTHHGPQSSSK